MLLCQGHIWQEGFAKGELTADLYEDVQPAMAGWVSQGIKIYIYSSGSREAQRNLFGHSKDGDLRGLLSGFFDTSSGSKVWGGSCADACFIRPPTSSACWLQSLVAVHPVLPGSA